LKLNIGSGRHAGLAGYTSVDLARSPHASCDPDIIANALSIPLPDGCAEEVMAIHLFEHLRVWEAPLALAEWHRLLQPGGLLVLEMPDIKKCCKNLVKLVDTEDLKSIDSLAMHGIYGDPSDKDPLMGHAWGWTPKTLKGVLKKAGFGRFVDAETRWHPIGRRLRDFRVEARKL